MAENYTKLREVVKKAIALEKKLKKHSNYQYFMGNMDEVQDSKKLAALKRKLTPRVFKSLLDEVDAQYDRAEAYKAATDVLIEQQAMPCEYADSLVEKARSLDKADGT